VEINLVAVGFTLGLAASVLYLGAIGNAHGHKKLLLIGLVLSIIFAAAASWAPNIEVLIAARVLGGVATGMVYPVTLAMIVSIYSSKQRTQAIALWSGISALGSGVGAAITGWLLTFAWWGAGFAITIPLGGLVLLLCAFLHRAAHETSEQPDNLSGLLSVVMIATLVAAITFAPMPGLGTTALALAIIAVVTTAIFTARQRKIANPIFDLSIAKRPLFWVAAIAGLIVFGSLMGSLVIGQQLLQDVLGYSTLLAGLAILPAALGIVPFSPVAGVLMDRIGSRLTLLIGFALVAMAFLLMLTWKAGVNYAPIGIAYFLLGAGVAIAAAPASRAIMDSVPPSQFGMGSATNDLQRDLGGAIMQSVMGTLLVVRYASDFRAAFASAPANEQQELGNTAMTQMLASFSGAQEVAKGLPQADATQLLMAAQNAYTAGSNWALAFALFAVAIGALLVFLKFPKKQEEIALIQQYQRGS
jgi:EmrB/QacA subfamily drug resistance transporter